MKLRPDMYKKSIHDINYNLLKERNIKCLIFDLDNTIALIDEEKPCSKAIELLNQLKKDFIVVIVSNNYKKRVEPYAEVFACDYVSFANKPLLKAYRRIQRKYNLKKTEMCVIGDQVVTDIMVGKRFGIFTILVEPLAKKDLRITTINRFIESLILKRYTKKGIMKKGEYYE